MQYSDVIFDIDGTLTDSNHVVRQCLQKTAMQFLGRNLTDEEMAGVCGAPAVPAVVGLGMDESAASVWLNLIVNELVDVKLFDGVSEMLHTLKDSGVRLGIITSESRCEYEVGFGSMDESNLFDLVLTADDTKYHKPHPGVIVNYMDSVSTYPERVLYVGDSLSDMTCASDACVFGAQAMWSSGVKESRLADFHIDKPQDLLEILGL